MIRSAESSRRGAVVVAPTPPAFGLPLGATPVVVANLIVFGIAGWRLGRSRRTNGGTSPAPIS